MEKKKENNGEFVFRGIKYKPFNSEHVTGNAKFNESAELIENDKKLGVNYYRKNGKEFYDLTGPKGNTEAVEIHPWVIGNSFNKIFNYINSKNSRSKSNAKELIFVSGEIPFMEKKGKTYEYSAVKVDVGDGREMIIVDSRLSNPAKIANLYHELVHSSGNDFPLGVNPTEKQVDELEKEVHLQTISGLRSLYKEMPKVYKKIENGKVKGLSDSDLSMFYDKHEEYDPQILRDAVNYAIASRDSFDISRKDIRDRFRSEKPGKLETSLGAIFFIMGIILSVFSAKVNGLVIGENITKAPFVGIAFILIGALIFSRRFFRKGFK
ncbi:MAG: hypothetical protein ACP5OG_01380 [Candidatus Nanoarchaeia archaeon]